jgi:mannose-1-phosphate guanylyltransferase
MFVVVKTHQCYYDSELSDVHASRIVVQPVNIGTSAAIVYSLLRIRRLDKEAIVGFFPTDHHYADERAFKNAVQRAYGVARRCPGSLVLLAADPHGPEVDYGWIEPHPRLRDDSSHWLYRVNRFCEKPSRQVAQRMLERGCLWNTFVMVGRVGAFLEVLEGTIPDTLHRFAPVAENSAPDRESERADRIYGALALGDFSKQVLSMCTNQLIALRAPNVGWSDLGNPERVAAAMTPMLTYGALPRKKHISREEPIYS